MKASTKLIDNCLTIINEKYGTHSQHYLPYHNEEHAHDVMDAAKAIGIESAVLPHELELLEIAACFHDVEHGIGHGEDERTSAEIAGSCMQQAGYTVADIKRVKAMILATVVSFKDGTIYQSASEDVLTQIIADADLASFGRPFNTFWDRSLKLRAENGQIDELIGEVKDTFISTQKQVLQKHQYYLQATEIVFPHKSTNIRRLDSV